MFMSTNSFKKLFDYINFILVYLISGTGIEPEKTGYGTFKIFKAKTNNRTSIHNKWNPETEPGPEYSNYLKQTSQW